MHILAVYVSDDGGEESRKGYKQRARSKVGIAGLRARVRTETKQNKTHEKEERRSKSTIAQR